MRTLSFFSTVTKRLGAAVAAAVCLLGIASTAHAAGNNNIKIFEVYGAGNLAYSEYAQDTIILFNPTSAAITMTDWSIQTRSASGDGSISSTTGKQTPNTIYKLPTATIPAGGFYAIAGSSPKYTQSPGCQSNVCNVGYQYDYRLKTLEGTTCDASGTGCSGADNLLSSTSTVIFLANTTDSVAFNNYSSSGPCIVTSTNVVDFVGIGAAAGSAANCYEGSNYAPYYVATTNYYLRNQLGTVRKSKCVDTDDNANDFTLAALTFYNSSSTPALCPTGTQMSLGTTTISPTSPGNTDTVTITAAINKATPASTTTAYAYLQDFGVPNPVQMYDDGTHGDATANDGIYSVTTTLGSNTVSTYYVTVVGMDATGSYATTAFPVTVRNGTLSISSTAYTATVASGGVATFPITVKGANGYQGTVVYTCSGTPLNTTCVVTPPYQALGLNGTNTTSFAISTGTTTTSSSSMLARGTPWMLLGLLSMMLLSVAIWRRRHLPLACLLALACFMSLQTTGCETNAGLGNTSTAAGTYNITLTATDLLDSTVYTTATFSVTVK